MKVTQIDSSITRKILANLCTNADFVKEYILTFPEPIFKGDKGAEIIEKWAIGFYKQHHKAISTYVQIAYTKAVRSKKISPEILKYLDNLLAKLSDDLDQYCEEDSVEILIELATEEATKRQLESLKNNLSIALDNNDIEKAKILTENYKAIERKEKLPIFKPFAETEKAMRLVSEDKPKALITFDGDLQKEWGNVFTESSLVYIEAPAKGKKSYVSQWIGGRAFIQGRKVLEIQLGDLSEANTTTRLYGSITRKSINPIDTPVKKVFLDCYKNMDNSCMCVDRVCTCKYKDSEGRINPEYLPCSVCRDKGRAFPFAFSHRYKAPPKTLTAEDVEKVNKVFQEKYDTDNYRTMHYSAKEFSIEDLMSLLKTWAEDKEHPWIPEVIILDYDKLLKNILPPNRSTIDQMEASIIVANKIRLMFNCCLIINSQARGRDDSLNQHAMLSEDSYSGTIAKQQYATAVISLNKSPEDVADKVQKVGTIMNRNGSYIQEQGTYIVFLQDMSIGRVAESVFIPTREDLEAKAEYEKDHNLNKKAQKIKKKDN